MTDPAAATASAWSDARAANLAEWERLVADVRAKDPPAQAKVSFTAWRQGLLDRGWMKWIEVEGQRLCYVDRGAGPVVALMHGHGGSAFDWRFLVDPLLDAGFRVITPDVLGSGYSDKPAGDYTLFTLAEWMAKLYRKLGLSDIVVGGNSYGGGLALVLAQRHPDLVRGLVLLDPVCYRHPMPAYLKVLTVPYFAEMVLWSIPARMSVDHVLREGYYDASRISDEARSEYAHELALPGAGTALIQMIRDIIPPNLPKYEAAIAEIRKPALVLWGRDDRVLSPRLGRRLHRDLRGSRLRILPECGHMPNQERPELVLPEVLRFLADLDGWTLPEEWNPAVEDDLGVDPALLPVLPKEEGRPRTGKTSFFFNRKQAEPAGPADLLLDRIAAAAGEIHKSLGPGLPRAAYEDCLCFELAQAGTAIRRNVDLPVTYKTLQLEQGFRADLIVDEKVIVCVEEGDRPTPAREALLLGQLKRMNLPAGMLLAFDAPGWKNGVRRVVNADAGS